MQKDAGLFLQQHGASRAAINSGHVLGYSTCPKDIDGQRKRLIQNYPSVLGNHIINAIQVINSQTSVILTNHSFISTDRMCICTNRSFHLHPPPHLSNTVNNLAASFNEGLLKPTSQSSPSTPRDTNNNDDSNEQDNINHLRSMTDPAYYQSAAWESHIDSELASFHVTQPQTSNAYPVQSSQPAPLNSFVVPQPQQLTQPQQPTQPRQPTQPQQITQPQQPTQPSRQHSHLPKPNTTQQILLIPVPLLLNITFSKQPFSPLLSGSFLHSSHSLHYLEEMGLMLVHLLLCWQNFTISTSRLFP